MTKFSFYTIPGWILCSVPALLLTAISFHTWGPGLSPDSASYLSAAASFQTNGTFIGVDGLPLTNWPPLYPVLLSIISGALLNQLVLVVCSYLIWNLLQNAHHRTLLTTLAVLSFPMLKLSSMIWSEMVFLCLLLTLLVALKKYNTLRADKWLPLIALLLALLCLQRYVGVFFAGTLLLFAIRYRLYTLAITTVLGILPLFAWFLRNHAVKSNTPFSSFVHLDNGYQNLKLSFETLSFSPATISAWIIWWFITLVAAWFIVDAIRKPLFTWRSYLQAATIIYLMVVLNWSILSPPELVRYLLPVFPLTILLLHSVISRFSWLLWTLLGINLVVLGLQSQSWIQRGAGGYSTQKWKKIPVKYIVESLPEGSYKSNAPDLIFLETGKRCRFSYAAPEVVPHIIWIPAVSRHANLYQQYIQQGYTVTKDTAGIQVLTKP